MIDWLISNLLKRSVLNNVVMVWSTKKTDLSSIYKICKFQFYILIIRGATIWSPHNTICIVIQYVLQYAFSKEKNKFFNESFDLDKFEKSIYEWFCYMIVFCIKSPFQLIFHKLKFIPKTQKIITDTIACSFLTIHLIKQYLMYCDQRIAIIVVALFIM